MWLILMWERSQCNFYSNKPCLMDAIQKSGLQFPGFSGSHAHQRILGADSAKCGKASLAWNVTSAIASWFSYLLQPIMDGLHLTVSQNKSHYRFILCLNKLWQLAKYFSKTLMNKWLFKPDTEWPNCNYLLHHDDSCLTVASFWMVTLKSSDVSARSFWR